MRMISILVLLFWPLGAAALELDCVATRACVSGAEVGCQDTEVPYSLKVGRKEGAKVVMTTEDDETFYEFARLPKAKGLLLQASGGALEDNQGAGALSVFDDYRFVLTRHSRIVLNPDDPDNETSEILSVSIHGTCEEPAP